MDHIILRGLRAVGTHGVLPEERARAQPFEVDVDLGIDLTAAGTSDDLADTVDYGDIASRVSHVVASEHHSLLERLAQRIAEVCLSDERVVEVEVAVRKLRPPVPVDLATAEVRIRRRR